MIMTFRTRTKIVLINLAAKTARLRYKTRELEKRVAELERRLDKLDNESACDRADSSTDGAKNTDEYIVRAVRAFLNP